MMLMIELLNRYSSFLSLVVKSWTDGQVLTKRMAGEICWEVSRKDTLLSETNGKPGFEVCWCCPFHFPLTLDVDVTFEMLAAIS